MRVRVCLSALSLLIVGLVTGCGGGGSGSRVATVTQVSAPNAAAVASGEPIVTIVGAPSITKAQLEHWVSVDQGFEESGTKINGKPVPRRPAPQPPYYSACIAGIHHSFPGQSSASMKAQCEQQYVALERKALAYLITANWVRGEAAKLHLTASHSEVMKQLHRELKGKYSLRSSQTKVLLAYTGERMGDLVFRTQGELLRSKVAQAVVSEKAQTTEAHIALGEFQGAFEARWKSRTNCRAGYVVEECMQFKVTKSATPVAETHKQKEEHTYNEELREKKEIEKGDKEYKTKQAKHEKVEAFTNNPKSGSSRPPRANGETYNTLAGMNLTSPAFENDGQIPVAYTCEGAGISPPLHWVRVPSEAKSLALFVIDDTQDSFTNPNGGVRWLVANINPEVGGLNAGQVPEGAVVGKGNNGKTGYGPICAEKGGTDQIEFLVYAFKENLNLKPGFSEQELEAQYGGSHHSVMLSEHATFYGMYKRP